MENGKWKVGTWINKKTSANRHFELADLVELSFRIKFSLPKMSYELQPSQSGITL
jgi:hypothetical protein